MYITDPIEAVRQILTRNPSNVQLNITLGISTVSFGTLSSFYSMYGAGKVFKKDFIRDFQLYEQPRYYPNVRIAGVACGFVNTSIMTDGYNPSVGKGDQFMIDYITKVTAMCKFGTDPDVVGQAHVEAGTLLLPSNNSIYLVLSGPRSSGADIFYNIYTNDYTQQYKIDNNLVYLSLGLNLTHYINLP